MQRTSKQPKYLLKNNSYMQNIQIMQNMQNIWDPESLPLDPLGPCRPSPSPPGTLKAYHLTPWDLVGLPLEPLGPCKPTPWHPGTASRNQTFLGQFVLVFIVLTFHFFIIHLCVFLFPNISFEFFIFLSFYLCLWNSSQRPVSQIDTLKGNQPSFCLSLQKNIPIFFSMKNSHSRHSNKEFPNNPW